MRTLALFTASSTLLFALGGCVGDSPTTPGSDAAADTSTSDGAPTDAAPTDSGTDAKADAGFSVKSVAGLVLWLDASQGVTQNANVVSAWADQSGANNVAAMSTPAYRPLLVPSSINGKPALRFENADGGASGTHLTVSDGSTLQFGTGDFFIAVVLKYINAANAYGMVLTKQAVAAPYAGPALIANFPQNATSVAGQVQNTSVLATSSTGLNDGTARQITFSRSSGTLSIRVNGNAAGSLASATADVSAIGRDLTIGANDQGGQALRGDVAEIVAVKVNALSMTDVTNVEGYLKDKYGL